VRPTTGIGKEKRTDLLKERPSAGEEREKSTKRKSSRGNIPNGFRLQVKTEREKKKRSALFLLEGKKRGGERNLKEEGGKLLTW